MCKQHFTVASRWRYLCLLYIQLLSLGVRPLQKATTYSELIDGKDMFFLITFMFCFFFGSFFSAILSLKLLIKCDHARHLKGKFQKCTNQKCLCVPEPDFIVLLVQNRFWVCCVFTVENENEAQSNQIICILSTVLSVLLMQTILPECNAQRKWRSSSQLRTIKGAVWNNLLQFRYINVATFTFIHKVSCGWRWNNSRKIFENKK